MQAVTHFARALGAARSGNPDAAKADIAKLADLRDKLRDAKDAYWSEQVDIQRQVATAWLLYAEGKRDDALGAMSAAADAEDKTEKHPVTPGVPKPARELYGVMLLENGNAKEAITAFEATLKKEPNRLGAYVGAAIAAEKSGDNAKAREYYKKVVEIADAADDSQNRCCGRARVSAEALRGAREGTGTHCETTILGDRADSSRDPGGGAIASGHRIFRPPWRVGVDRRRYRRHVQSNQGILRTLDDEAHRIV